MKLLVVHVLGDALALPVSGSPVPDNAPTLPFLVGYGHGSGPAQGLVANTTGEHVTVNSSVARQLTVDGLEDV